MVEVIGYKEGLPVVVNPGFSPENCTDTSQKLSIRFGETIKAYEADPSGICRVAEIPHGNR